MRPLKNFEKSVRLTPLLKATMEFAWQRSDGNEFQSSTLLQKKDYISAFDAVGLFACTVNLIWRNPAWKKSYAFESITTGLLFDIFKSSDSNVLFVLLCKLAMRTNFRHTSWCSLTHSRPL
jgi:hypothetical protein